MSNGNGGKDTVGITLRIDKWLLRAYSEIAHRANDRRLRKGQPGNLSAQDVMRHRLGSLPVIKARANKERGGV